MGNKHQLEASDKHQRNYDVAAKTLYSGLGNMDSTLNSLEITWIVLGHHLMLLTTSTLPIFNSPSYITKDEFPGFSCYFWPWNTPES